jgi:hypothetical protein
MRKRLFGEHFAPRAERSCVDAVIDQVGQPKRQSQAFEDEDDEVVSDVHRVLGELDLTRVERRAGRDQLSSSRLGSLP